MIASVKPHPRIQYVQFEADTLPLQPSFGYGVGPQTLSTTRILNPAIGKELNDQCIIGPVWMNFRHGGEENTPLPTIEVPSGVYGRIGREELLDLLDSFRPDGHVVHFGKRLRSVIKESGLLNLKFEDGTQDHVNAIWACDGMNSLCRKLIQGESYKPATYSGMIAFRGKADSKKIEALGEGLASETHMFIGVPGWHVLTFPIAGGKLVNIAAFAVEKSQKTRSRAYRANKDEVLGYFPGANETVKGFLRVSFPTNIDVFYLRLTCV
jgi:salicylate hydroxylase